MGGGRRSWEEDYVLKQAFSALVPAFDPRPGRTNVPQIQDFEVAAPGSSDNSTANRTQLLPLPPKGIKLALTIRVSESVKAEPRSMFQWGSYHAFKLLSHLLRFSLVTLKWHWRMVASPSSFTSSCSTCTSSG